ncbi:hypothetical protein GCWB2_03360 [Gordonia rubripertincta]|nr:hypothetical protein GCWB2_03360 [Gordonia rubripertincta]
MPSAEFGEVNDAEVNDVEVDDAATTPCARNLALGRGEC